MAASRAALSHRLANFTDHELASQCPTRDCRFRRFSVAPIAEARFDIIVAEALARLRCAECGEAPEIVLLVRDSISGGVESIALRVEADAWRPMR
jgi:hypothetical protein